MLFVFNDTATTEIYPYGHILALPDALPIFLVVGVGYPTTDGKQILARRVNDLTPTPVTDPRVAATRQPGVTGGEAARFRRFLTLRLPEFVRSLAPINARCTRSEEHTSELQSLMRISYAVFCLKKKNTEQQIYKQT